MMYQDDQFKCNPSERSNVRVSVLFSCCVDEEKVHWCANETLATVENVRGPVVRDLSPLKVPREDRESPERVNVLNAPQGSS